MTHTPISDNNIYDNTDRVFHDTIDIINTAIRMDDTEGGMLAEQLPEGKAIGVAVFDRDPGDPEHVYRVRFDGEQLEPVASAAPDSTVDCRLAQSHLRQVCDQQDDILERPLECELVWMMARMAA